ncbi:tachykinin-like peptides receptor 86C isoform X2 [Spodoptera frugiperda]|uniref:Tachykinin-like peptides receptor 86C isoform X2 n=1 Tax=Spodoptera frugiperda TaxID=7108 RepID=A0A9R0EAW2_SPOFR|nr:tachykinin-like peptides receptor 86C isoform X2 [Spodoptera frugiperda]
MDIMYNISLERQKFYATHDFNQFSESRDVEVVYTWNMDFNRSILGAATILVPKTTATPSSTTMPTWAHNSWVCLFTAMLAVAIGGNVIVIWIVTAHRRMRTVTNYFLVNLSFADLMMASLNCLFNFIYMLHSDWVFGVRYCQLSNFIANVTVAASVFTLTGISFDRYQAIVRPMRPRMSKTCSLVMIACIWISGMLLAIPCLLYSTTKEYRSKGTLKTACLLSWPDGLPDVSYMDFVYQVLFFVVTYAIPMLGMTFFYSAMGKVLWGSGSIGELTQRQVDSIRSKRKVVKMFILVIVIFGICWLPYHCYFIYTHFNPSILYMKYVQHMYLGFYWLAMANAMVNPIIYYWMNAKFRTYFRTAILCRWRDILRRRKRPLPESPPDCISQSGSRSRSGIEELRNSRGSAVSEWQRSSYRMYNDLPLQRPHLLASCPKCPHGIYYDAYIHGRKV